MTHLAPERPVRRGCARFALSITLGLLAHTGYAGAAPPADPMTLEGLMARFAASRGVRAHFVEEKHLSLLVEPLTSEGMIFFIPPRRLARHVSAPLASVLTVDGDSLTIRTTSGVDRVDLGESEVARHFVEGFIILFSGDLQKIQQRYTVSFESDGGRWRIGLAPRQRVVRQMIESIELRGNGLLLQQMDVIETQGDRTTTRFDAIDSDHLFESREVEQLFGTSRSQSGDESTPVE